jgi:hypothetical protein
MITTIFGKFAPYIAACAALLASLLGIYVKGRKDANNKHNAEKAKANEKTHKRMDHLPPVDPNDHDDIIERLRKHSQ